MPWPSVAPVAPVSISTASRYSLGRLAASWAVAAPVSDWPAGASGDMCAVPIRIPERMLAQKLWILNGANTSGGNVQMAIYDDSYRQIVASSVVAQGTANTIQEFDIADTWLDAGSYYVAQMQSTVSLQEFYCFFVNSTDAPSLAAFGAWKQSGVGSGMPALATPITYQTSWSIPIMGVMFRTLV